MRPVLVAVDDGARKAPGGLEDAAAHEQAGAHGEGPGQGGALVLLGREELEGCGPGDLEVDDGDAVGHVDLVKDVHTDVASDPLRKGGDVETGAPLAVLLGAADVGAGGAVAAGRGLRGGRHGEGGAKALLHGEPGRAGGAQAQMVCHVERELDSLHAVVVVVREVGRAPHGPAVVVLVSERLELGCAGKKTEPEALEDLAELERGLVAAQ